MTANGYGDSILGHHMTGYIASYKLKSSTLPFHISLTRQKKSGIRRSKLKKVSGKLQRQGNLVPTDGLFLLLTNLLKKMFEQAIPAVIAIVTGTAVLFNKVNQRVTQLDHRVDKLELKLVESFTTKTEFSAAMERMESHMIRIEDKLDKLVDKKCAT